jgi:hypothetical protein
MSSSDRPTPPADLSLKYMAWDIKKIGEKLDALPQIARQLEVLNNTLAMMLTKDGSLSKISKLVPTAQNNDEIPF